MPNTITALPDTGSTSSTGPGQSWIHAAQAWVAHAAGAVPPLVWVLILTALTLGTLLCVPALRTLSRKAGKRHGKPLTDEDRRDRRLLIAAMVPASLFWIAVLVGSGRGLIAFGREDLHWKGGWEFLVPFTLDGVAIAFALLAFRAVRKLMNPDRAVRIAAAAMLASAGINFLHEVGGSKLGAAYLAILSALGMLIFDELLAQFEEGTEQIKRSHPKFGLRWLTWPTNTACAWVAWRNYPPADNLKATIGNAVEHLESVRRLKTERRAAQIDTAAWWMRFAPWSNVKTLRVALDQQRSAANSEQGNFQALIADLEQRIAGRDAETERMAERFRDDAERTAKRHAEQMAEQESKLRSEAAEQIAAVRAELSGKLLRMQRSETAAPRSTSKNTPAPKTSAPARMSDAEALRQMFQEHPEADYAWTDREVNRITGAGFSSRAPRLTGLAVKHQAECPEQTHKTCYTERSDGGSADAEERAS